MDIDLLNKTFSIGKSLYFKQLPTGTAVIEIVTPQANAMISLEGGQVVSWHPKSQVEPVLWVSKLAQYVSGKAIRGGVPICWPWFGAHPSNSQLPGHGYARITPWQVDSTSIEPSGIVDIKLALSDSDNAQQLRPSGWPKSVALSVHIRVGASLEVSLITSNSSDCDINFTEGLHTYFKVGDVNAISIGGLEEVEYVDLINKNTRCIQEGPITFNGELGRIFMNTSATCVIEDPTLNRRIKIEKQGSLSTAVWNPWTKTASTMADLGAEGWRDMVCVEGANALENSVKVAPGASHTHTAIYSVENIC